MKEVLLLVFSNLKSDARMIRHIEFLRESYKITACCLDAPKTDDYETFILQNTKLTFFRKALAAVLLLLKRFTWAHMILHPYTNQLQQLKARNFDLIIANDIETMPFAFQLKGTHTKVLFDAHEYAPRHFEDKLWWRVFFMDFNNFLCKKFIPKSDAMITVSLPIADEYEKHFGLKPTVITNAGYFKRLNPMKNNSNNIRLVHHGSVGPSRKIELIIDIMRFLPDHFSLDLILVVPTTASKQTWMYMEKLKNMRAYDKRVRFIDPVPMNQVVDMLQQYDMGIILAPPINFNYINGLPNKLYDYIQARIGVISGPTREIARVIKKHEIGVVSEGFTSESFAKKISSLSKEDISAFKEKAHQVAHELSSDQNQITYNNIVKSLIGSG